MKIAHISVKIAAGDKKKYKEQLMISNGVIAKIITFKKLIQ